MPGRVQRPGPGGGDTSIPSGGTQHRRRDAGAAAPGHGAARPTNGCPLIIEEISPEDMASWIDQLRAMSIPGGCVRPHHVPPGHAAAGGRAQPVSPAAPAAPVAPAAASVLARRTSQAVRASRPLRTARRRTRARPGGRYPRRGRAKPRRCAMQAPRPTSTRSSARSPPTSVPRCASTSPRSRRVTARCSSRRCSCCRLRMRSRSSRSGGHASGDPRRRAQSAQTYLLPTCRRPRP